MLHFMTINSSLYSAISVYFFLLQHHSIFRTSSHIYNHELTGNSHNTEKEQL